MYQHLRDIVPKQAKSVHKAFYSLILCQVFQSYNLKQKFTRKMMNTKARFLQFQAPTKVLQKPQTFD